MLTPGNILRSLGFNGDGSEIWLSLAGNPGQDKTLMPLTGGPPRSFLGQGHSTPSWSPDNTRLVYIGSSEPGDPLSLADRTGADPLPIVVHDPGKEPFFSKACTHTIRRGHQTANGFTSCTGRTQPAEMDVWRMRPSGESPEQLTHQHAP